MRMEDVAARAGVSRATVSRVLSQTVPVNDETREAVLAAVGELGYVTNTVAQQLARRNSTTIGLLLRDPRNPVYGSLAHELQRAAEEVGLHIVSVSPGEVDRRDDEAVGLTRLMGTRPAGLLVATGSIPLNDLRPFAAQVPTVILPRPVTEADFTAVSFDEIENARMIARAVADHGHRHVGVAVAPPQVSAVEHLRATTMADYLEERGIQVERLVRGKSFETTGHTAKLDEAARAGCTAIMFPNDVQAATYIAHLRATGRAPGTDISITGLDGIRPWAPALGLATVEVPIARVAAKAIELMLDGLSGKNQVTHHAYRGRLRLGPSLSKTGR